MKHKTNIEKVKSFMDCSPIHQAFLIDAMEKLTNATLKDEQRTLEFFKNCLVSGEAWIACAKEWQKTQS